MEKDQGVILNFVAYGDMPCLPPITGVLVKETPGNYVLRDILRIDDDGSYRKVNKTPIAYNKQHVLFVEILDHLPLDGTEAPLDAGWVPGDD